ncbi:hypothetical protein CDL12_23467 [Handroanthus impetiginosus]|uniref:Aluminum-activated malate transporter n=1 Tax=Handroanthus impetiginosus TaxID=429701 RepID=A0A2G9GG60_9LAMI|nr:hypothetical protein CDL12_23467 [Handroanthus impetiginosus]
MEMNIQNQEKATQVNIWRSITSMPKKLKSKVVDTMKKTKKIGKDDPRRIVHAMKVGLALTLVSLFYYLRPLYDGFGQAGMWAILTVVVVFEFTVGGTLSKSINRGFATLLAGALGVGAEYLADFCGEKGEPVILGLMVFFLATAATFTRFFPNIKRKYDYGVLIFILTFSLVAVSGFRVPEIFELGHQRLSTILIGGATCIMISLFVCPVWAGQDLHNLIAGNIEKLGAFLEGFGGELSIYLGEESTTGSSKDGEKSFLRDYKSVLNSKASEESLANFAWWEPAHGQFMFHHPWKQYLTIGALARECACLIQALNGCINPKSQPKVVSEIQTKIQQSCIKISIESGQALKELSSSIKKMMFPSPAAVSHVQDCKAAADDLRNILQTTSLPTESDLQEIMPILVTASILIDIINCVEKISLAVHELSDKAHFQKPKVEKIQGQQQLLHRGIVKPIDNDVVDGHDHVVVQVHGASGDSPENKNHQLPE